MTTPKAAGAADLGLPMFWPIAAAEALFGAELDATARNLKFLAEAAAGPDVGRAGGPMPEISSPGPRVWRSGCVLV